MREILADNILKSEANETTIFSVGQAGYIIKSKSGQLLAIDLYLSDYVEKLEDSVGFKRLLPHIISPAEIIFDFIIATHPHGDHYDYDSMPILMNNNKTILYASVNCKPYVDEQKISKNRVFYKRPGDMVDAGDFKLYFVDCDHGIGAPDAFGIVVEVDGKKIYEAGDTCLRLDYADEVRKIGNIDVMIAPINGAYGNLNERDCVSLSEYINPGITIPCHYGMFASHGGNPGVFIEEMTKKGLKYDVLTMGEGIVIG